MHFKNTVEAVYISLDEIQKIVSQMGADDHISTIDIDLAADKIRHVYDLLLQLKNEVPQVTKNDVEKVKQVEEELKKEERIIEPEPEDRNEIEFDLNAEPVPEITEEIVHNDPVKEEMPPKTQAEIDSRVKPIKEKKFLSDSFEGKSKSLNEELSNQSGSGKITDKLSSNPISSLSSAIGINEKFEIIKNLFGGNGESYERTMQQLNTAGNFNEAYEYMSKKLGWDMDDPQVQRILELIRRKLIVKKNDS